MPFVSGTGHDSIDNPFCPLSALQGGGGPLQQEDGLTNYIACA